MENNNINPNPNPEQQPQQVAPVAEPQSIPNQTTPVQTPAVNPTADVNNPQNTVANPQPELVPKKKKGIPKIVLIGAFAFLIIIIIMMILSALLPGIVPNPGDIINNPQESTTPTPTPSSAPVSGSPYANDPEVLEIEENIIEFDKALNNANLREDKLRIPTLEWDVEFD